MSDEDIADLTIAEQDEIIRSHASEIDELLGALATERAARETAEAQVAALMRVTEAQIRAAIWAQDVENADLLAASESERDAALALFDWSKSRSEAAREQAERETRRFEACLRSLCIATNDMRRETERVAKSNAETTTRNQELRGHPSYPVENLRMARESFGLDECDKAFREADNLLHNYDWIEAANPPAAPEPEGGE